MKINKQELINSLKDFRNDYNIGFNAVSKHGRIDDFIYKYMDGKGIEKKSIDIYKKDNANYVLELKWQEESTIETLYILIPDINGYLAYGEDKDV